MQVFKNCRGLWEAVSDVDLKNGETLRITTMKRSDGKLWSTSVRGIKEGKMFTFDCFNAGKRIKHDIKRVTSKNIVEAHIKAVPELSEICVDR